MPSITCPTRILLGPFFQGWVAILSLFIESERCKVVSFGRLTGRVWETGQIDIFRLLDGGRLGGLNLCLGCPR
jgi:hypothetical protein